MGTQEGKGKFYLPKRGDLASLKKYIRSWSRGTGRVTDFTSRQFDGALPDDVLTASGLENFLDSFCGEGLHGYAEELLRCGTRDAAVQLTAQYTKACMKSTDGTWEEKDKLFVASQLISDLNETTMLFPAGFDDWDGAGIQFGSGSTKALLMLVRRVMRNKGRDIGCSQEENITNHTAMTYAKEAMDLIHDAICGCTDAELSIVGLRRDKDTGKIFIRLGQRDFRELGYQDMEHIACKIFLVLATQSASRSHNCGKIAVPHVHPCKPIREWPPEVHEISRCAMDAHLVYLETGHRIHDLYRHSGEPSKELVALWKEDKTCAGLTLDAIKEGQKRVQPEDADNGLGVVQDVSSAVTTRGRQGKRVGKGDNTKVGRKRQRTERNVTSVAVDGRRDGPRGGRGAAAVQSYTRKTRRARLTRGSLVSRPDYREQSDCDWGCDSVPDSCEEV